jgi:nitroreductase
VATQAPTGLGGESWRFLVVTEQDRKQAIAEVYRSILLELVEARAIPLKPTQQSLIDRMHEIPVMILVCTIAEPPAQESVAGHVAFYGSILPAAWSLMLALRARNLGTTWTSLLSSRQNEVADILDIPAKVVQTVMFPVAYTKNAKLKRADRLQARHVTFWESWGEHR